jgi:hypothetical protein
VIEPVWLVIAGLLSKIPVGISGYWASVVAVVSWLVDSRVVRLRLPVWLVGIGVGDVRSEVGG